MVYIKDKHVSSTRLKTDFGQHCSVSSLIFNKLSECPEKIVLVSDYIQYSCQQIIIFIINLLSSYKINESN